MDREEALGVGQTMGIHFDFSFLRFMQSEMKNLTLFVHSRNRT